MFPIGYKAWIIQIGDRYYSSQDDDEECYFLPSFAGAMVFLECEDFSSAEDVEEYARYLVESCSDRVKKDFDGNMEIHVHECHIEILN